MAASRLSIRALFLGAVLWGLLGPGAAFGQAPAEATRVRILLVIDDHAPGSSINGFAHDHTAVKKVLKETFRDLQLEDRYTLDILDGKNALSSKVLAYYRDLKAEPTEVLVCYFSGHGGADPSGRHFFDLEDGQLKRSDLRAAMLAKKTRLVVLISDCCADYGSSRENPRKDSGIKGDEPLVIGDNESIGQPTGRHGYRHHAPGETLRQLLFHHQGIVDVTSCQIGKQAFSNKHVGGYFTLSLVALLLAPPDRFQMEPYGVVSWSSFFVVLRRNTEEAAGRERNAQTPIAFSLGKTAGQK
jgi:hypothetical protein